MATAGRPRAFDRDEALDNAMLLFWRKGFAAASMTDLCEAMHVGSPSLYAVFGSKESLYLEAFERYIETQGPPIWDKLDQGTTGRDSVAKLLRAGSECLPKSRSVPAGCMVMLAAVGDEWPPSITRAVKKVRSDVLDRLRSRLEKATAEGELPASTDIDGLSRFYLSVFQGMAVQAKDGATSAELSSMVSAAMAAWPIANRASQD